MIIVMTETIQYEVASAKWQGGKIVATKEDGTELVIGGDLSTVYTIGGEIEPESVDPAGNDAVWDELDAAYTEGVNGAYDE